MGLKVGDIALLTPSSWGDRKWRVTECAPGVPSGAAGTGRGAVIFAVRAGLDGSEKGPPVSP